MKKNHEQAAIATDPLLKRLQHAVGRFEIRDEERFVRVIADIDMKNLASSIEWRSVLAEAIAQLISGVSTTEGLMVVQGLAARMLVPGETALGYDPAIPVCFDFEPEAPEQGTREEKLAIISPVSAATMAVAASVSEPEAS